MNGGLAPLPRRLLCLVYEALLLAAVLILGALPFTLLTRGAEPVAARPLFQLYLIGLAGLYFAWQWRHGGQTLPMRTWRLKLVARDGSALTAARALQRYLFALAGTAAFGLGYLWALVDPERQFLHDRLVGTRIVIFAPATTSSPPPPTER